MRLVFTFLFTLVIAGTAGGQNYTISTFAGGIEPPNNILGNRASLYSPGSVALDATGNVFFSDSVGQVILRLDATTGVLTLVAGNGTFGFNGDGGLAVNAQLNQPSGVAVDDATGNHSCPKQRLS